MMIAIYFIISIPTIIFSVYLCFGKRMIFYSNAFWISIAYILGILVKPLFVALEIPSSELIQQVIAPVTVDQYWVGSITLAPLYLLFLIAMLPMWRATGNNKIHIFGRERQIVFKVYIMTLLMSISLMGMVGFLIKFPELLKTLNKNVLATADLQDYDSGGMWRLLISFSLIVTIFALYNIGKRYRPTINIILFLIAATIYLSFNILSDQRSLVLTSSFIWLATYHLYIQHIRAKAIVTIISIFIFFGVGQTLYRVTGSLEQSVDAYQSVVANIVGRNGIEHSKTIYIVASVPERIDFQFGKSFLEAIAILIPRALFPEKLTVNIDTKIGREIFGSNSYGSGSVPPGLIAEMYLNFHVIGIFFGVIFLGKLTGSLDRRFDNRNGGVLFELFYLLLFFSFGAGVLGSGFSSYITQFISNGAVLLVSFLLCRAKYKS
jgi:oligosaccharide repeat unit polymerase